jgi:hypothetical protein
MVMLHGHHAAARTVRGSNQNAWVIFGKQGWVSSRERRSPSNFEHKIASSLQARNAFSSVLLLAGKPGSAITTHCLCGINHLRFLLYPTVVHCGQEGIRRGPDPNLALFRISRAAAESARFRDPGVPSRQSAYFGFFSAVSHVEI